MSGNDPDALSVAVLLYGGIVFLLVLAQLSVVITDLYQRRGAKAALVELWTRAVGTREVSE